MGKIVYRLYRVVYNFACLCKEWLTQFFVANDVKDKRKVAVFLSVIGPKTLKSGSSRFASHWIL